MTITSTSSVSNIAQLLQSTISGSGSSVQSTVGSELLAALEQSQSTNSQATSPLIQDLVSLTSNNSVLAATGNTSTYNAQGLLSAIQNSALASDPLLQTLDPSNTSGSSTDSLLGSVLSPSLGTDITSALSGATSTSSSASTGSTTSAPNLAQMIQTDPALASVLIESQLNQSVLGMFPP